MNKCDKFYRNILMKFQFKCEDVSRKFGGKFLENFRYLSEFLEKFENILNKFEACNESHYRTFWKSAMVNLLCWCVTTLCVCVKFRRNCSSTMHSSAK